MSILGERIAFTRSPRWRLSFSEWTRVLGSATPIKMQGEPPHGELAEAVLRLPLPA
jgi:hypothetical protein